MAKQFELTPFDKSYMLYGNYIGVVYVLETPLDNRALDEAWKLLNKQFPALATRYNPSAENLTALSQPAQIKRRTDTTHVRDLINNQDLDRLRKDFVLEPNRKMAESGSAPMATLTVTHLAGQGTALGFAVAHSVTDAGGFHRLAKQLADNYNAYFYGSEAPQSNFLRTLPEFNFGTARSWESTQDALAQQNLKVPVSLKGIRGWFMRRLITLGMKHIMAIERQRIHFTPDQVATLKATVLRESGEDWISTNVALCAHFSSIMVELIHGSKAEKPVQLGQLLDLRHRYFDDPDNNQGNFIGNAILIHSEMADLQDFSRGSLARQFKAMTTGLNPNFITKRMDLISDCFRHGHSYPGLDMKTPMVCVNNQTKMPAYDLDFGVVKPSRILPQDVGDNIMFFPARDGGVDTYLRVFHDRDRHADFSKPDWQVGIYDI